MTKNEERAKVGLPELEEKELKEASILMGEYENLIRQLNYKQGVIDGLTMRLTDEQQAKRE